MPNGIELSQLTVLLSRPRNNVRYNPTNTNRLPIRKNGVTFSPRKITAKRDTVPQEAGIQERELRLLVNGTKKNMIPEILQICRLILLMRVSFQQNIY
jgi:hypothetical protein